MPDIYLETESKKIKEILMERGLEHLKVNVRGKNVVVYSEYEGEKENRIRLTSIKNNLYNLSVADHNNKWETTPFDGTANDLIETVVESFSWVLIDYSKF